ncbi:MAG: nicotinate phosphoribosyltransferase [Alphaproteobacteria bacterium]|nr:nicotinate phosphoribosyltransferase [Alphaproteobacteria bacterium]
MGATIIKSLLDTDLYKLTMMQSVLHAYPAADVEYEFHCRNAVPLAPYVEEIRAEIKHLCSLRFNRDELNFLSKLKYIKPDFINFLRLFQLSEEFVSLKADGDDLALKIRGPWLHTIMFEVPVLAIVNEVFTRNNYPKPDWSVGQKRLEDKIALLKAYPEHKVFRFSDFGTRRRFSRDWQGKVVQQLKDELPDSFVGTSNLMYAKDKNLVPIGTMAHEYLQAFQALGPRLIDSQKSALECWVQEYRGDLGIALTDVVGMDAFLRDFDLYFAKLFDGIRHDSGDPYEWTNKALEYYKTLKIDPRTKRLVYSDGLSVATAIELHKTYHKKAKVAFGIGTHLTNDFGYQQLQIVMKMTRCNGQPVAKISDTPGKTLCRDEDYMKYLSKVFQVPA